MRLTFLQYLGLQYLGLQYLGKLDRIEHLEKGLDSYRVPDDLEPLMRMLVQALAVYPVKACSFPRENHRLDVAKV
ncbi:MAG: hypothetical protein AAFZ80_11240 [Cyanobacteria bacterium P01_A01_bin.105]